MATITNHTIQTSYRHAIHSGNIFTRFFQWSREQEGNRLLWLGLALTAHGCILTPLTIMAVLLAGTNMVLFIITLVAMGASLVTNLAALPTRITVPVFALSILIDIVVIIICLATGFDISRTYI